MLESLILVAAVISITAPQPAQAQIAPPPTQRASSGASPFLANNRVLQASLERISRGSTLWREALDAVRQSGRQALVVTPAEVTIVDANHVRNALDGRVLAEAFPVVGEGSEVTTVVIVVNLRLVQDIHDARLSVPRDFEADIDRILVHEVYGHAVPYLITGDLSARCADPEHGQPATDACSIRRENAVRAELGLGRRADRGLYSLRLASGGQ